MVGYGNDLRGDDAAGRMVAAAIEAMGLPGVAVRSQPQLTPELAMDIAGTDLVVFVDADVDAAAVTVAEVGTAATPGVMTHHGDPASLVAMVPAVGDPPGRAVVVSIPATSLDLTTDVSRRTEAAVAEAIELVRRLVAPPAR